MLNNPYSITKAQAFSVFKEDIIAIVLLTAKWLYNNTGVKNEDNRYVSRVNLTLTVATTFKPFEVTDIRLYGKVRLALIK